MAAGRTKRNGNNNKSEISRMILEHFEFMSKEEQPKPEDIRKTLFTENDFSIKTPIKTAAIGISLWLIPFVFSCIIIGLIQSR